MELLGQGWNDCLHLLPDLSQDLGASVNRVVTRARFYFMDNNFDRLLERYNADFGL